jgi:hypothetical protein
MLFGDPRVPTTHWEVPSRGIAKTQPPRVETRPRDRPAW